MRFMVGYHGKVSWRVFPGKITFIFIYIAALTLVVRRNVSAMVCLIFAFSDISEILSTEVMYII
jgi:hypothetical protein